MNLFTICDNPTICVQSLDDILLRKSLLESAQMLSTAIRVKKEEGIIEEEIPEFLYKKYNAGEEHNVWVRESQANYRWTFYYLLAALEEYKYRYDDTHGSKIIAPVVSQYEKYFPNIKMTPFPRKFNQKYGNYRELMEMEDTFKAYKDYLSFKWDADVDNDGRKTAKWTKREKPEFYKG